MRALHAVRRALLALLAAAIFAAGIRLRGKGGLPPQVGGWREVDPSEL